MVSVMGPRAQAREGGGHARGKRELHESLTGVYNNFLVC